MVTFRMRSVFFVGVLLGVAVVQLVPEARVFLPTSADHLVTKVILEGGPGGWISLDPVDAMPLPFTKEVLDAKGLHSSASPTCIVVPERGSYRIVAAAVFELDESGERELFITTTPSGGVARQIGRLVSAVPEQTVTTQLAIFVHGALEAGDCVELYAGAPGHHAGAPHRAGEPEHRVEPLFAFASGFALWEF